jgi:hypothetical protein
MAAMKILFLRRNMAAMKILALLLGCHGFSRSPMRRHGALMRAQETDTEYERFCEFNGGMWRGKCRSVLVDALRKEASRDPQCDGRRYTSCVKASKAGVDEALSWDDEDNETVVSLKLPPGAVTGDFDGSFSAEHAAHNLVSASAPTFAAEAGLAVADDERVRVVASYDGGGSLARVAYLDEVRIGANARVNGAAVAAVGDVFALAGDWKGDATIRKPGRGAVNVLKQDLELHTDGDRLFRALTVYDAAGDAVQTLESFGDVATASLDADFEFVVFRDVGCCLVLSRGAYVLAPLSIERDKAFYIEAGVFITEPEADLPGGQQLPISIRGAVPDENGDVEPDFSESKRFLSRSVRLYSPDRTLASVTTSYHQLYNS